MWLIVGLGNPGKEYVSTRHNAGWMAVDFIASEIGAEWKADKKHDALVADGVLDGQKVLLVKPQTFMNLSGAAVQPIAAFYKIAPKNIIVVHDDMDFDLGVVRAQFDRTAAGHNGVQDITDRLGSKAFHRIRIGIGPKQDEAKDFVLAKFTKTERETVHNALDTASQLVRKVMSSAV